MSYPYRVSVTRSVAEEVTGGDRHVARLSATNILPSDDMRDLVAEKARARGWKDSEEGKLEKQNDDGTRQVLDLETMEVETTASVGGQISRQETVEATGDTDFVPKGTTLEQARAALAEKAGKELEASIKISDEEREAKRAELSAAASAKLAVNADARRRELNEIVRDAEASALKAKAKTIGRVVDVAEGTGGAQGADYELTITIQAD